MDEHAQTIEGGQSHCDSCSDQLCLRKQVINLALGNDEKMFCLKCLAKASERAPEAVLVSIKGYILARQCFKREWERYLDISFCPEPCTCFPDTCFAEGEGVYEG